MRGGYIWTIDANPTIMKHKNDGGLLDQQQRSYVILARVEGAISVLIFLAVLTVYLVSPGLLLNPGISFTSAILGTATAVYYVTLHQIIGPKKPAISALIMSIMTYLNIILIIAQTGGLDSPYYSLWLLAIVTAGLFSGAATVFVLGITATYYVVNLAMTGFNTHYARDHVIQLILSLVAGGLAEWVHSRNRLAGAQNVSAVKSLSGQLTQESLKTKALMSSIGEGVLVIDTSRRVQLFNKAAQETTGWDEKSAQGIDYRLILKLRGANDAELTPETDPIEQAWAQHKTITTRDLNLTTQGQRKLAITMSVSPIYDDNQAVTGAIALFRDITAEKAVERQKDEFVSTASHEMRTPVAAIEGYLSLALNPSVATTDARAQAYLKKAHDAVQHLGELFRDLLSVTNAEEGKLQGHSEAVDLTDLVKQAVEDMQFAAQKKSLSLIFAANSSADPRAIAPIYYVKGNPERLREVVMNLIDNALKFTAKGGVTVTATGDEHEATVTVTDTGIGINNEDSAHLFQKFYRIDSSATRTIGGTGLGLYLSRTVIELSGGRIWVTSKPGQGSTFSFALPRLRMNEVANLREQASHIASATSAASAPPVPSPREVPSPAALAAPNPNLTRNAAATVAAALAAHPPKK
jgi:PAS domain S-box-containing protein